MNAPNKVNQFRLETAQKLRALGERLQKMGNEVEKMDAYEIVAPMTQRSIDTLGTNVTGISHHLGQLTAYAKVACDQQSQQGQRQ